MNCTFTNAGSSSNETIEDFPQAVWHDGASWKVTGAVTTTGNPTVTAATGHFSAATDINDTISGTNIPANSFIVAVNSATSITLNNKASAATSAGTLTIDNSDTRSVTNGVTTSGSTTIYSGPAHAVTTGVTTNGSTTIYSGAARTVANGHTTNGSTTITSATAAFTSADVGATVLGNGIPANDTIASVTNSTTVVLTTAATATGTTVSLTFVRVSSTFTSADVGATVLGTGIPANDTIASVTNSNTAVLTTAATATGIAKALTFVDLGSNANFTSADVGGYVTGTNIPGYDTIASVTNAYTAVLTTAATASGTAQTLTIDANQGSSTTREITDAQVASGSTTLTSASANFQASDAQLPVTGCGIPTGTYIASVTDSSHVVLSQAATVTRPFTVSDGVTTSASTAVTSATAGFSAVCDAHEAITGAGIPVGAFISSVTNATSIVLSAKATATATGVTLTESSGVTANIGLPTPTAPANGDAVSTVATTLALQPSLVKGSPSCALGEPTGDTIEGGWYNPGSYLANTLAPGPTNLPTDTIGEILYPTAVVSFAGYVVNEAASTAGELDTAAHTDIILPFVPTGLALCATPALGIGSSFTFNGTTLTQQKVATGVGIPGTGAVRGVENLGSGVSTTSGTGYLTQTPSKGSSPYSGACTTNFPAAVTDVPCS